MSCTQRALMLVALKLRTVARALFDRAMYYWTRHSRWPGVIYSSAGRAPKWQWGLLRRVDPLTWTRENAKDFAVATYYRRDELSNAATARCRSRLMLFQWRWDLGKMDGGEGAHFAVTDPDLHQNRGEIARVRRGGKEGRCRCLWERAKPCVCCPKHVRKVTRCDPASGFPFSCEPHVVLWRGSKSRAKIPLVREGGIPVRKNRPCPSVSWSFLFVSLGPRCKRISFCLTVVSELHEDISR